jgi:hypothetical protein
MNTWQFRLRAILINCGIGAALIYRYWTGTPLLIIVILGFFLFTFANALMLIAHKQSAARKR